MKWDAVIGGVALAALVSMPVSMPASAADMTPIGRAIPATSGYIPAQFLWTGFYIGAGIGGAWGTATFTDPLNGGVGSPSLKGFLVGGVTGINYQVGSVVLGVEGDFTGTWAKGSVVDTPVAAAPPPAGPDTLTTNVFWTASITGRLGWAFDRLLVYGKGGAGFAYDRDTITTVAGAPTGATTYRAAWTVGGGMEYAITEHWTGRLEYDYFRFPVKGLFFTGPAAPGPVGGSVGFNLNEIKVIMAYKF